MEVEDIVYFFLLLFTIGFGEFFRRIDDVRIKQICASAMGCVIVLTVSGIHIIHPLIETAINGVIICFMPHKYCHITSFTFSFLYLLFFRFVTWFGLPPPPSHTNAIQMLLTLKVVGLALEVSETAKLKNKLKDSAKNGTEQDNQTSDTTQELELSLKHQGVAPNFLDIFHYAFCFIGILTGPYYKYRTYWDMIHSKDSGVSYLQHASQRLRLLPCYILLFIVSSYFFPLSYAKSDEIFEEHSLAYRLWYMTPLFFTFRMRFYSGFILSEVACIVSGLGAYPIRSAPRPGQGPTILQNVGETKDKGVEDYNFETVHNIDEYAAEFYDVRGSLKSWNMTVQWWLAVNVHRRFPLKPLRTTVTMLVSAFWHGVYSGYYLSMLTVPFILVAEDLAKRKVRYLNPKVFDVVAGFMKIQWFSYMGIAFSLLAMDSTLAYWKSIYFIGHVMIVLVYVGSYLTPLNSEKPNQKIQ